MLIDDLRDFGLVGAGSWSCNVYGVGERMCITGERRNGSVRAAIGAKARGWAVEPESRRRVSDRSWRTSSQRRC